MITAGRRSGSGFGDGTMRDFSTATYTVSAPGMRHCPPDSGREVAFAGRSNAGKSSTLNAITGRRGLARTGKTPGRTQALNFFALDEDTRLVDLPGFGFARVPERMREAWRRTIDAYLRERRSLCGVVLVMDIRHPLKDFEQQMLTWCGEAGVPLHILLNKSDKLSRGQVARVERMLEQAIAGQPDCTVQAFSALRRTGLEAARLRISELLDGGP